ncbi:hypothetical protein Tco_0667506 [Tanacetum coccineum]
MSPGGSTMASCEDVDSFLARNTSPDHLIRTGSGYQQKDRKPSQNDKNEHGMEKTVQNQGQRLEEIWMAALLSQYIVIGLALLMFKSYRRLVSQITSQVAEARALYSAFIEDLDTTDYFLLFQETRESPIKMANHVTDLFVLLHLAQSESE